MMSPRPKKARKIAKTQSTTSASLGVRLTGMQVFDPDSGNYICRNKYFGRTLNQESFIDTIEDFFKSCNESTMEEERCIRSDIMTKVVATIEELITVLNKLETYRFYTASLLVTYDGDCGSSQNLQKSAQYDIRMIDFAHSTHKGLRDQDIHEGPDLGFIQGLKSLVRILEEIMQKHHQD